MSQLKKVVEPFGEVNVFPIAGGGTRVTATILMEPRREGAQTGIALDGSGSMKKLFGQDTGGGVVSSLFAKPKIENVVAPVAQKITAYLARTIDADHGTTCVYWAVGNNGSQIEVVGDLTAEEAERHPFAGPKEFGTGTQLLPAVRYFVDRFKDAPWGFFVFITDGELFDLDTPPGAHDFTMDVNGNQSQQPLADTVAVPSAASAPPRAEPIPAAPPSRGMSEASPAVRPAQPPILPSAKPAPPPAPVPVA